VFGILLGFNTGGKCLVVWSFISWGALGSLSGAKHIVCSLMFFHIRFQFSYSPMFAFTVRTFVLKILLVQGFSRSRLYYNSSKKDMGIGIEIAKNIVTS
jgi:hypothetical protein